MDKAKDKAMDRAKVMIAWEEASEIYRIIAMPLRSGKVLFRSQLLYAMKGEKTIPEHYTTYHDLAPGMDIKQFIIDAINTGNYASLYDNDLQQLDAEEDCNVAFKVANYAKEVWK
jgi:hypothetical protein